MEKTKRINEVVLIRIFAILSVVLGHSIIVYTDEWVWYNMQIPSNFLDDLKAIINIYQMPLFISISGYLFYYLKIERDKYSVFSSFLQSKFKRLLIPFAIVGTLYMLPLRLIGDYPGYEGKGLFDIIFWDLLIGLDAGNLWFLPVLFIIFIIFFFYATHAFKKSIQSTLFHFIIFYIISLISFKTPNYFYINDVLYYALFFFFGFHLFRFRDKLKKHYVAILIISGLLQFSNLAFENFSLPDNIISTAIILSIGIASSLFSCLFFYTLFIKISELNKSLSTKESVLFIDENSFGLYLFHSPLLYPVLNYFTQIKINPFLFSTILFVFISSVSLILTVLLSRSKYLKVIVGK